MNAMNKIVPDILSASILAAMLYLAVELTAYSFHYCG